MDKIAVALQRSLAASSSKDSLFSTVDAAPTATPRAPVAPGKVEYSRTRTVEVPAEILERHRVAALSNDASADAFRTLRTEVLLQMRQNHWRTLAITSPNKGAGKSTVALNLAISFGLEVDHTALLVDADLRDADVRHLLELEPGPGLSDYLAGKSPLEDVLVHPRLGNLVVLPGGEPVPNSSELLRSPMMADLVQELRNRYPERISIFDAPPLLSGADTLALSGHMDAMILLVEERKTTRADLERSYELLKNANVIGIVLNKSRELRKADPITWPEPTLLQRILRRFA
jgi:capsular exopolysaccharide synthesis family protein